MPTATRHLDDTAARIEGRRRLIEATREAALWRKPKRPRPRPAVTTE